MTDAEALDRLSDILTGKDDDDDAIGAPMPRQWPRGADFIEWCAEIVKSTGRPVE